MHRLLLTAVLLSLVEEWGEHLTILHRFVGGLGAEDLVGFKVVHGMHFNPVAPDLPLLSHPPTLVGDLDPGAVDCNDDIEQARSLGVTGNERPMHWIRRKMVV